MAVRNLVLVATESRESQAKEGVLKAVAKKGKLFRRVLRVTRISLATFIPGGCE
jgi:hypothetical protein